MFSGVEGNHLTQRSRDKVVKTDQKTFIKRQHKIYRILTEKKKSLPRICKIGWLSINQTFFFWCEYRRFAQHCSDSLVETIE